MKIQFSTFEIQPIYFTDAEAFFEFIDKNRKRIRRFFPVTSTTCTDFEKTKAHILKKISQRENREFYFFKITENNQEEIIGCLILKSIDWRIPKGEMAYFIDKNYEGKGITSRAIGKLIDYIFEEMEFKKVFLRIAPSNIGSIRIAEKNGFELEGRMRKEFRIETGVTVDVLYYGKLKT